MTGYVRPCRAHLSEEDWNTYRAVYCGVCRTLGKRYGQAFRALLQYDMVFYALLLLREPAVTRLRRCIAHPVKRRFMAETSPSLDLAADATVLFAVGQLRDHVSDGRFGERAVSRMGLAAMRNAYRKASRRLPEMVRSMEDNLRRLSNMEAERISSLDRPAAAFSAILGVLGETSPEGETSLHSRERRVRAELMKHLGRWIYLIDACDDYEEDLRRGLYNPVAARYGLTGPMPDEILAEMRRTLEKSRHAAQSAFDLYEACAYPAIAENILHVGLAAAEQRVLDHRPRSKKRMRSGSEIGG